MCACSGNCHCSTLTLPTGATGATGASTPIVVPNTVYVSTSGSDTTGTAERLDLPFLTIAAAYTAAVALSPSTSKRISIVLFSGTYAENLTISTANISLISYNEQSLLYDGASYSTIATRSANALRSCYINGTITITVDRTELKGLNLTTLAINHLSENSKFENIIASTSITTNTSLSSNFYDVHSSAFLTTTNTIGGYFEKCTGGNYSFASGNSTAGGIITGKMIDCIGVNSCFASSNSSTAGDMVGATLINCKGSSICFASSSSGTGGNIDGSTLINCESTDSISFASSSSSTAGTIISASKLIGCRGTTKAFIYGNSGSSDFNCYYENCYAQGLSFGSGPTTAGTLDGYFYNCVDEGDISFASTDSGTAGTLSGNFVNCTAGETAFVSSKTGDAGTISGRMVNCGINLNITSTASFASSSSGGNGGQIDGYLKDCVGGAYSFCSTTGTGGTVSVNAKVINCTSDVNSMLIKATISGKIDGARVDQPIVNASGIIVDSGAVLCRCDIRGNGSGNAVYAGAGVNITATYLRTFGYGFHANVTNTVSSPFIIDELSDTF